MVRPHHRGNRLLHLPGLSADPRPQRTRACGYSGSNPASAPRSPPSSSFSSFCCAAVIYLFPMFVIVLRVPFLSPTYESLHCASFIYSLPSSVTRLFILRAVHLSVSNVRHSLTRPFLSPTCESLYCASFVCLSCASFIYLFPMFVIHLRVPFLSPTLASCLRVRYLLSCVPFCLMVTAGAEGRKGCQTRWRAGRIKGWAR
jgi:hypothetical protein